MYRKTQTYKAPPSQASIQATPNNKQNNNNQPIHTKNIKVNVNTKNTKKVIQNPHPKIKPKKPKAKLKTHIDNK